jgi:hypothetical protein
MNPREFFNEHTYYMWDTFLDEKTCKLMSEQVFEAYKKGIYYDENPSVFDNLVQNNTKHIEKQGYTRKYKAIYGEDVKYLTPLIYDYYMNENVIKVLSDVCGCTLYPVPAYKTVDQAVQIYNTPGDGTNWHHDRSIFNGGRAFTFLTVIHNTSDQQLTVWTEKYGIEKIPWSVGKAVFIEKFKTYHSVTPLGYGQRILLTLTYCEKPYTPSIFRPIEYALNKSKNFGYIGFNSFTILDWSIVLLIILLIILCLYFLYKRSVKSSKKGRGSRN